MHYFEDVPLEEEGTIVGAEEESKIPVVVEKAEIQCARDCISLL